MIVQVKDVKEGNREASARAYEGVVVAGKIRGLNSAFTVRKISAGTRVERTFQTSPLVAQIDVKRRGDVRRASCTSCANARASPLASRKAAGQKTAA